MNSPVQAMANDRKLTTARIYLMDRRMVNWAQLQLEPRYGRKPAIAEIVHEAMMALRAVIAAEQKNGR